ncbi:MAG: hypothetical protein OXU20_25140 [Myxococcales bacterium]|nr:hypothetical protein [Myxococcales bacterium]
MSKIQASWVHGAAVVPEREGYFVTRRNYRNGSAFKTHGKEWFLFAVPTPVLVDSKRAKLIKAFVLFETGSGARITDLEVFDGGKKIATFGGLSLTGNHSTSLDQSNSWIIEPPISMTFGLAICVRVDFGNPQVGSVPAIRFASAGVDLLTD